MAYRLQTDKNHTITRLLTILGTGLLLLSVTNLGVADQNKILRMATTTSTENSGLLKDIMPAFEKATGYQVRVTPVGTGKALRLGQDGDVDVVLVHAPPAEEKFVVALIGAMSCTTTLLSSDRRMIRPKSAG